MKNEETGPSDNRQYVLWVTTNLCLLMTNEWNSIPTHAERQNI